MLEVYWSLDFGDWPALDSGAHLLSSSCTVAEVTSTPRAFALDCEDPEGIVRRIRLELAGPRPFPLVLAVGDAIHLHAEATHEVDAPTQRLVVRDEPGRELRYVGIHAHDPVFLAGPEVHAPLTFALATGLCPIFPDDCGTLERWAVDVAASAAPVRIFDGNEAEIDTDGSFAAHVEAVDHGGDSGCPGYVGGPPRLDVDVWPR